MSYIVPIVALSLSFIFMWLWMKWRDERKRRLYERVRLERQQVMDEAIDRWHALQPPIPLHEYLGLTHHEYEQWLRDPDAIDLDHLWSRYDGGRLYDKT